MRTNLCSLCSNGPELDGPKCSHKDHPYPIRNSGSYFGQGRTGAVERDKTTEADLSSTTRSSKLSLKVSSVSRSL